jgi:hypothetical protein
MIVWGGQARAPVDTGGRYDPVGNEWHATATEGAPSARESHSAVWTGSRMVVWGGEDPSAGQIYDTGGRYDPASNSWTATTTEGARTRGRRPSDRLPMIVWGGWKPNRVVVGMRIPTPGFPLTRPKHRPGASSHGGVDRLRMVVWGGAAAVSRSVPMAGTTLSRRRTPTMVDPPGPHAGSHGGGPLDDDRVGRGRRRRCL